MSIKNKKKLLDKPMCPLPDGDPNNDFDDREYGTQNLKCPVCSGSLPQHDNINFCPWCRQALDYTHIDYDGRWKECVHKLVYSNVTDDDRRWLKIIYRMCICSKCGEIIWEIDDCYIQSKINQEEFFKLQGEFYGHKSQI